MMIIKAIGYWTLISVIVTPTVCAFLFGGCGWTGLAEDAGKACARWTYSTYRGLVG